MTTSDPPIDPAAIDPAEIDLDIDIAVTVETPATPAAVWDVIWALDRYGEWNPECVEAAWSPGCSAPVVGATFTGRNEWNGRSWTVTCHVIECDPPHMVRWTVEDPRRPSSTWSYAMTAHEPGPGCTVTERFVHGPGNSGIRNMIRSDPSIAALVIGVRTQMLTDNMQAGLQRVVARAEHPDGHADERVIR